MQETPNLDEWMRMTGPTDASLLGIFRRACRSVLVFADAAGDDAAAKLARRALIEADAHAEGALNWTKAAKACAEADDKKEQKP